MFRTEIVPGEILNVIVGETSCLSHAMTERKSLEVYCDDVRICKVMNGKNGFNVTAIACDHFKHGGHPKFRKRFELFRAKLKTLNGGDSVISGEPCPKCDGSGWLPPDTEDARQLVLMATVFRIFRGIPLGPPPKGTTLDAIGLSQMMEKFLSAGVSSVEADSKKIAQVGRVIEEAVAGQNKKQGKE